MNEQEVAELRSRLAAAEKAREEAERERDEARRCLNAIPNGHPGCAKDHSARLAEWLECWICKEEAAESRAARLGEALRASVVAMKRWSAEEDGLPVAPIGAHEAVAAAESIVGYVWAGWGPDPTRAALGEEGKWTTTS